MLFRYLIMISVMYISCFSFAQGRGGGGSKFSIGAMVLGGQGKMGNGQTDAPDRDMFYIPVAFYAGFNIKKFRLGVNYEYSLTNQTTDPATVASTNLSGTTNALGLRLEYYNGSQSIGAVYRASVSHALEKQTFLATSATYKGSGLSVQYMIQIKKKIGLVLDYTMDTYSDSLATGSIKSNRVGLGLVFANFAGGK